MTEKKTSPVQPKQRGGALWFGLLFFVSVWMFVLGIIVGRGTVPVKFNVEKLYRELAELKQTLIKQELRRYKIEPDDNGTKPNLDYHEALKNPKEDIGLLPLSPEPQKKRVLEKSGKPSKVIRSPVKNSSAAKVKKDQPATIPQTASAKKRLTIQVISVKDKHAADEVVKKLKQNGYPAYRISGQIPGKGLYYRVRIGPFTSKSQAQSVMSRLKKGRYKPLLILE
ncbi:SPOR domain-containing protein [Thermodesulfobacteriota bacterium]